MKRKIIISVIVAIAVGLVIVGFSTDVLTGTVFPMLKKAAMAVPQSIHGSPFPFPCLIRQYP